METEWGKLVSGACGAFSALPCPAEEALGVEVVVELVHTLHLDGGQHAADCVFHGVIFLTQIAISVMMITAYIFELMSLRFEGAMGFHCN